MSKKKKSKVKHDLSQLEAEYNALRPVLVHDELDHQLGRLLYGNGVSLGFPIQHRVKSWSSIVDKLQRVPLPLGRLRELQDLVGFRIVLQFRRDADRVCSLIQQNLQVVAKYDTVERLREDQFGYASIHFVVEIPESWLAVPTMTGLADLRAEVQVRTTAQHIWAEASQTLQYKSEKAVPPELRRAIYRVSALLETVDLEFERVLTDRATYKSQIAHVPPSAEILNVDTLGQVLDVLWPAANKDGAREDYAELLTDLTKFNLTVSGPLTKLIEKWRDAVLSEDAERADEGFQPDHRFEAHVYYTHCGLTRVALGKEFGSRWHDYSIEKHEHRILGDD